MAPAVTLAQAGQVTHSVEIPENPINSLHRELQTRMQQLDERELLVAAREDELTLREDLVKLGEQRIAREDYRISFAARVLTIFAVLSATLALGLYIYDQHAKD